MKPGWVGELLEFLAGLLTAKEIRAQGAEPIPGAVVTVPIAVTGYAAARPPAGVVESRNIADCTPYLQERWPLIQARVRERAGRDVFLTCTWRSSGRQGEHFLVGRRGVPGERIITNIDGVTKMSRHNFYPSQAFDVCMDADPGPGKHPVWDEAAYEVLGPICEELGLVWGGAWKSFKDLPHIEQPAGTA